MQKEIIECVTSISHFALTMRTSILKKYLSHRLQSENQSKTSIDIILLYLPMSEETAHLLTDTLSIQ
jgi:hypothetical protein